MLIACARVRYGDATLEPADVDWSELERLAQQHAVTPIVADALAKTLADPVPTEVRERFQSLAAINALRNLELAGELLRLLDRLDAYGIEAIPYKGPVLAADAYGDLGMREFVDLDILVGASDIEPATAILVEDGYRRMRQFGPRSERFLLRHGHDRKLLQGERFVVELQWALADDTHVLPRDLSPLFRRRSTTKLGGRDTPTLCPEDVALVLCVHGSVHFWERLAWVCDLAQALRRWPGLDHEALWNRARAAGVTRAVLLGLEMARRLLAVEPRWTVPAPSHDARAAAAIADELIGVIFSPDGPEPRGRSQFRLRLAMKDRARDRRSEAFRLFTTPSESDWRSLRLPDQLWAAYYPIRVGRLAWAYAGRGRKPGLD